MPPTTLTEGITSRSTPPARVLETGFNPAQLSRSVQIQDVQVRAAGDGSKARIFSGYAALYETRTQITSWWAEEIATGAFNSALARPDDVRFLIDHDTSPKNVLGRTKSGTLKLSVDEKGLFVECTLPDTAEAATLAAVMDRGDVDQMSFAFTPTDIEWQEFPDGNVLGRILDLVLFDVSVVTFPAYEDTTASLRAIPTEASQLSEWLLERYVGMDDAELRVGKKLSAKHLDLATQARDKIQELLDSAADAAELEDEERSAAPGMDPALEAWIAHISINENSALACE